MSLNGPIPLKGDEVRRMRHAMHLTQKELGLAIGRYQPDISDMELGRMPRVYPATLSSLAEALGVTMEELVCEKSHEERKRRDEERGGRHGDTATERSRLLSASPRRFLACPRVSLCPH